MSCFPEEVAGQETRWISDFKGMPCFPRDRKRSRGSPVELSSFRFRTSPKSFIQLDSSRIKLLGLQPPKLVPLKVAHSTSCENSARQTRSNRRDARCFFEVRETDACFSREGLRMCNGIGVDVDCIAQLRAPMLRFHVCCPESTDPLAGPALRPLRGFNRLVGCSLATSTSGGMSINSEL